MSEEHPLFLQVGASKGVASLQPMVAKWAAIFRVLPGELLLPFLQSLLTPPSGGKEVALIFMSQMIHAVSRLWLHREAGQEAADSALLLLAELCTQVIPQVKPFCNNWPYSTAFVIP